MIFNESNFPQKSLCIGITLLGLNPLSLVFDDIHKEEEEEELFSTNTEKITYVT
jgi:hypothetical protein